MYGTYRYRGYGDPTILAVEKAQRKVAFVLDNDVWPYVRLTSPRNPRPLPEVYLRRLDKRETDLEAALLAAGLPVPPRYVHPTVRSYKKENKSEWKKRGYRVEAAAPETLTPPVAPITPVTPVVVASPPAEPVHQAKYGIVLQDLDNTIAHNTQKLQRNDLSAKSRAMAERIIAQSKATKDLFAADPSLFLAPDPAMMKTQAGVATLMFQGFSLQVRILDLALEKGYLSPQAYETAMKELDEQTGTPEQAATEAQELGLPPAFVSQVIALKADIAAKATGKVTKDKNGTILIKKKPNYLLWGVGALVLYGMMQRGNNQ